MKRTYIQPELSIVLLKYTTPLLSDSLTDIDSNLYNENDLIIGGGADDSVIIR